MNIRTATHTDIPALQALEQLCNPSPWSAAQLTSAIKAQQPVWVIDLPGHGIIAMLVWQQLLDEAEIHLLNTHPAHRRQGHAQQLLEYLFQQAQQHRLNRILLEVRTNNCSALKLYEHNGFRRCGLRRNYYQNGDDAVLMEKSC